MAVNCFVAMSTQWRSAGMGATGLDYGVLRFVMEAKRVSAEEWDDTFESIRIMEDTALHVMQVLAERERERTKRRGRRG